MTTSRREFLAQSRLAAIGTVGLADSVPRFLLRPGAAPRSSDILLVIFLRGGADALNMVIPYGEGAGYYVRRPSIGIPAPDAGVAGKAIDLDGFFALHPALGAIDAANWMQWYSSGRLAIVHAAHMDDPFHTRSHFDAVDFMERGTPGEKRVLSGWLGRHLLATATPADSPFRAVGMGSLIQLSLRGEVPAVVLQSIASFNLQGRAAEKESFQAHLKELYAGDDWLELEGQATLRAVELLAKEVGSDPHEPEHGAQYNDRDSFHRHLMQVAQLIKADVGLEVACVDIGGWDTHANQVAADDPTKGRMADLLLRFGSGITAFLTDLADHMGDGAGPGITVVTMSEFGRRATENASLGTDHGHGGAMFLFGPGIRGGQVHANPWPTLADDRLDRGDLAGTTEYRDVLGEILAKRMACPDLATVFPNHTFSFPGLVKDLVLPPTPTPTPTATPSATPTVEHARHEIHLPWVGKEGA